MLQIWNLDYLVLRIFPINIGPTYIGERSNGSMKKLSIASRLPISKLLHNKWSPAMVVAKYDADKNLQCVLCNLHPETFMLVFQCPSVTTASVHKTAKMKLRSTLKRKNMAPIIT